MHEVNAIDAEQKRVDMLDGTADANAAAHTETFLKKVDAFQAKLSASKVPAAIKEAQSQRVLELLQEAAPDQMKALDAELALTLDSFTETLDAEDKKRIYDKGLTATLSENTAFQTEELQQGAELEAVVGLLSSIRTENSALSKKVSALREENTGWSGYGHAIEPHNLIASVSGGLSKVTGGDAVDTKETVDLNLMTSYLTLQNSVERGLATLLKTMRGSESRGSSAMSLRDAWAQLKGSSNPEFGAFLGSPEGRLFERSAIVNKAPDPEDTAQYLYEKGLDLVHRVGREEAAPYFNALISKFPSSQFVSKASAELPTLSQKTYKAFTSVGDVFLRLDNLALLAVSGSLGAWAGATRLGKAAEIVVTQYPRLAKLVPGVRVLVAGERANGLTRLGLGFGNAVLELGKFGAYATAANAVAGEKAAYAVGLLCAFTGPYVHGFEEATGRSVTQLIEQKGMAGLQELGDEIAKKVGGPARLRDLVRKGLTAEAKKAGVVPSEEMINAQVDEALKAIGIKVTPKSTPLATPPPSSAEAGADLTDVAKATLLANAALSNPARLEKAAELLGKQLTEAQKTAVLAAHEVGANAQGAYTKADILKKARLLDEAGFTPEERRTLMEEGICGAPHRILEWLGLAESYSAGQTVFTEFGEGKVLETLTPTNKMVKVVTPDGVVREFGPAYLKKLSAASERARAQGRLQKIINTPTGPSAITGITEDGSYIVVSNNRREVNLYTQDLVENMNPSLKATAAPSAPRSATEVAPTKAAWETRFDEMLLARRYTPEAETVLRAGISPTRALEIKGKNFFLSEVYRASDGRLYAVGFVEVWGKLQARFFYKSESAGFWRSAPGVSEGIFSKGKGIHYTQETRVVPELEHSLEEGASRAKAEPAKIPELFDMGPGKKHPNLEVYVREVESYVSPGLRDANFIKPGNIKGSPVSPQQMRSYLESLRYPPNFIPNFSKPPLATYTRNHSLLGEVAIRVYSATLDGHPIEWRMALDSRGRAWVDSITFANQEVSSFGTNSRIIDSGILTAKPLEYNYDTYRQAMGVEGVDFVQFNRQYADQTPLLNSLLPVKLFRQSLGLR